MLPCAPSRITGKERDTETVLDYFGARYYANTLPRFLSPDPSVDGVHVSDPQSWNSYSYALNNPLVFVDTDGKAPTHFLETMINFHAFLTDLSRESRALKVQGELAMAGGGRLAVSSIATAPRGAVTFALRLNGGPGFGAVFSASGFAIAAIGASDWTAAMSMRLQIIDEANVFIMALELMVSPDNIAKLSTTELVNASFELRDIMNSAGYKYLHESQRQRLRELERLIDAELEKRAEIERKKKGKEKGEDRTNRHAAIT